MRVIYLILFLFLLSLSLLFAQEEGSVIITEIMYNPASDESTTQTQYIEIANTTNSVINLKDWTIDDEDSDGPNTLPDVDLPAYGIAVICGSTSSDFQGAWGSGYILIALKDLGQTMFSMANSPSTTSEIIQLKNASGTLIDEVNYDDASPWPADNNKSSIYLNIPKDQMNAQSNNNGANWSLSTSGIDGAYTSNPYGVWDAEDVGSPGNILGDASLPVTLASFSALVKSKNVLLTWRTESEVENLGFEIFRSLSENGQYSLIDSYLDNPELKGQGNSSVGKTYHYTDQTVQKGTTYYYKLADVSFNGQKSFHGPIKVQVTQNQLNVTSNSAPKTFKLYPNHPNPFNPSTEIVFDLPADKQNTVQARLDIYNINGQKVRSLLQQSLPTGKQYQIHWDGKDDSGNTLPAGIYFGFLKAGNFQQSVKMCLVK